MADEKIIFSMVGVSKTFTNQKKVLTLDFVYGSQNKDNPKSYPLDGQQRLTTLWLFHWYIALKAGNLEKACDTLKNFSYETRISSREFFQLNLAPLPFSLCQVILFLTIKYLLKIS